jgi:hypothetical protein
MRLFSFALMRVIIKYSWFVAYYSNRNKSNKKNTTLNETFFHEKPLAFEHFSANLAYTDIHHHRHFILGAECRHRDGRVLEDRPFLFCPAEWVSIRGFLVSSARHPLALSPLGQGQLAFLRCGDSAL